MMAFDVLDKQETKVLHLFPQQRLSFFLGGGGGEGEGGMCVCVCVCVRVRGGVGAVTSYLNS